MNKLFCVLLLFLFSSLFSQNNERFTINGYFSFEFEKMFDDEGKGDPNGSFDMDLIDLVLNFNATDRLRIATDITWEHGTATEDGRGNAAVEYAFAEYTINDGLKFRAGKMFTAFGIYNEIHTAKPAFLTVKEPQSTNKNQKFGSDLRFYPRWQTGIAITGNLDMGENSLEYIAQIANGEQENTNPFEEDDNTEKALTGRVKYSMNDLVLGFSFYNDTYSILDSTGAVASKPTQFSYGFQAEWLYNSFGVELEYVAGNVKTTAQTLDRSAYSAMLYYTFDDMWTPYVRLENLDPNADQDQDSANLAIFGMNIKLDDGLYLKAEINSTSSDDLNDRFKGKSFSEFKAAVAVGF